MVSQELRWGRRVAIAVMVAFALGACGSGTGDADATVAAQDPVLIDAGHDLFQANCAECHGADLRGTEDGPSLLSIVYEPGHHADGAFLLAVLRGVPSHHWRFGDMPRVDGVTPDDVTAIVAFVREQQRVEGFEPYPPP